jgi:exopolysaccharide production protein ExoZ
LINIRAMLWSVQILRFVAAMMVVYVHAAQIAHQATGSNGLLPPEFQLAGQAGVDIFFVISGLIIATTAPGLTPKQFAKKRIHRIMPVYLAVCVPAFLIALQTGASMGWREILASIALWPATDRMTAPILPVAWTLCFEALFYAGATLVLANRKWLAVLAALYATSFALRAQAPVFQFLGNPLIIEFLFGAALAYAPRNRLALLGIPLGAAAIIAAGFAGLAPTGSTLSFLTGKDGIMRLLCYGIPAALIVYGVMQINANRSIWSTLGDGSYMLYLTHPLLMPVMLVFWHMVQLPPDVIIIATAAVALAFAQWLHLRFEKPLLLTPGQTARPQPPTPDNASALRS